MGRAYGALTPLLFASHLQGLEVSISPELLKTRTEADSKSQPPPVRALSLLIFLAFCKVYVKNTKQNKTKQQTASPRQL
jgi:hypothetical protein